MSAYLNSLHEEGTREDLLREITKLYDENTQLKRLAVKDLSGTTALLNERGKTHGHYPDQAHLAITLREALRLSPGWGNLEAFQQDALDMITVKMSRIVCGDPTYDDHWDDIMGYGKLGKGSKP